MSKSDEPEKILVADLVARAEALRNAAPEQLFGATRDFLEISQASLNAADTPHAVRAAVCEVLAHAGFCHQTMKHSGRSADVLARAFMDLQTSNFDAAVNQLRQLASGES